MKKADVKVKRSMTRNGAQKTSTTRLQTSKEVDAKPTAAKDLRALFVDELQDIYWAEKALTKALPKMIKNSSSQELADALTEHLEATKEHVVRLEEVFSSLGEKAQSKKCDAMEGLIKEADAIMQETEKGNTRDAGIISASQKVEHYEIATYGTLCAFAKTLGRRDVLPLLQDTLDEEVQEDKILSDIADSTVNAAAVEEEDEDCEE